MANTSHHNHGPFRRWAKKWTTTLKAGNGLVAEIVKISSTLIVIYELLRR